MRCESERRLATVVAGIDIGAALYRDDDIFDRACLNSISQ
jgi:hypothetical protein